MKLRIRSSLLGNARFGLVVGLALASGVGCSDDDSVPDFPAPDGGGTESTATMDESSTGGGGNNTDETAATSDTSSADTLTVNPDTSTGSTTGGETSVPTDSSEPGTDTTDVMTTAPTSDIVDSHTSDLTLPTSEPMSSAGASTSMDTSSGEPLPNLVANGDFEAGTSGWSSWNGTLTASTTKARSGLQSAFQSGGDATGPVSTQVTPIVAGGTYEVTFWASVGSGTAPVRITRYLACADSQYLWVVNDTPVSSDGWTELTGTFTVPEDCDSSSVQVYAEGDTAGVDLYIDDVSVVLLSGPDTGSTDTTSDTGATSADVDSGVVDTTTPPDETTEMMPDGGVDASSTEPVDTTDEMTDPDASVTTDVVTTDVVTSDVQTSDATDGPIDPPVGISLITSFEDLQTVGFTQSDLEETFTAGASIGTLTVPFTQGGNQEAQLAFGISGDYCGYELVARVRLVSGFNVSGTAPGGVQLRVWSDNWGQFAGNWTTLNAVGDGNQLGEWVEYRFDMADAAAENASLNIGALNAAGIAFITGGDVEDAYSTSVFEIDWVGFEPTGAGCP